MSKADSNAALLFVVGRLSLAVHRSSWARRSRYRSHQCRLSSQIVSWLPFKAVSGAMTAFVTDTLTSVDGRGAGAWSSLVLAAVAWTVIAVVRAVASGDCIDRLA